MIAKLITTRQMIAKLELLYSLHKIIYT